MRIDRLRLFDVSLPLVHGFETSSHRKTGINHLLIEATDREGRVGWGEIASPADPYYGAETTETAWSIALRYLVPASLSAEWDEPEELESAWSRIRGHEFAKAGFSIAAWDLHARAAGLSLASALGGTRIDVAAGVSLGIEPSIDDLLVQVERQLAAGYGRIKLKIAPGWDVDPVRAVRRAHPDLDLHVDANGAYPDSPETTAIFRELDAMRLTMIEQPFAPRDFVSHSALQRSLDTPVCLDESIVDLGDLRTMLALDAGRVLNIKVSRMGGLSVARRAHALAAEAGVPVWCGGMHEFGIGRAANVAISSLPNFTLPSDVSGSDKYYARDIVTPPIVAEAGRVRVPTAPGLGYEVNADWLREHSSRVFDSAAGNTGSTIERLTA
ncbi:O-succinylbenzoate synthase [Microbacterium sp. W4I4]|uniref:o-succinylbenzoate synthase n=1 Tax=Microbacterium sp. W4I4 TaxID=3042295 RepID=UPI0027875E37|nr:o-succinylbenzoate synthase [Microbacterium sp. W4I4]MDQ0614134.1 O-succinylbenzoate synthase [Microbacterium sp. W4I4]